MAAANSRLLVWFISGIEGREGFNLLRRNCDAVHLLFDAEMKYEVYENEILCAHA